MSLLKNKIAVITGGSSGIGFATAKRFVEEGTYVFIAGRRQAELDKAVAEIGSNVTGVKTYRWIRLSLPDQVLVHRVFSKPGRASRFPTTARQ